MKWFKPKYSVCKECGVHFDPVTGYELEAAWGHLCSVHRKPVMERDLRKRAIIEWASSNWERLEEMYKKEMKETEGSMASYTASQQTGLEAMAKQQQAQGLGGLAQAAAFGLGGFLTGRG